MTLGDGKRKVLMLLDEYSSGGEVTADQDIQNKMADFFDMAQKEMAGYKRIIRHETITLDDEDEYTELPDDFEEYFRIWEKGQTINQFPIIGGQMYTDHKKGTIVLEYFARPTTIDANTLDTYEFEVSEDAANCLPFYVAAQQLITDLVVDYQALWNMYLTHRGALNLSLPSGGTIGVRQRLFRG